MNVIRPQTPSGYSLFCDDFRIENTGKHIYAGVYLGEMLVYPAFPIVLPSFNILIWYRERRGESHENVRIVVTVPGEAEPAFQMEFARAELEKIPVQDAPDIDDPIMTIATGATMRNFVVKEPGLIKVRAYRGDDEIRLGVLRVKLNTPPTEPLPPAP